MSAAERSTAPGGAPSGGRAEAAEFAGRRALVMGLGLFGGGAATARFLAGRGARVVVTDLRSREALAPAIEALGEAAAKIEFVLGEHRESDFTTVDLVVANPAVAPDHPLLAAARAAGVRVTSEMELCLERCAARTAAITGTQGKSSTTTMAAQLCTHAGLRAHLGGNVGKPLVESAAAFSSSDRAVLELSSYQLDALAPRLARGGFECVRVLALTNVLHDHLARHGGPEGYAAAKARLFDLPARTGERATVIVPARGLPAQVERALAQRADRLEVVRFDASARRHPEAALFLEAGGFRFGAQRLRRIADPPLPREFQRENALVALGIAHRLGASADALAASVHRLRGLPHRLEDLGTFAGRRVYDNGVSTTPDSTLSALQSLSPGVVLLVGGQDKELAWDDLARATAARADTVIVYGGSAARVAPAFRAASARCVQVSSLREAVESAFEAASEGATILFSPACASFDAYLNFEARAADFRSLIAERAAGVRA